MDHYLPAAQLWDWASDNVTQAVREVYPNGVVRWLVFTKNSGGIWPTIDNTLEGAVKRAQKYELSLEAAVTHPPSQSIW
jgi:hypothetical protein